MDNKVKLRNLPIGVSAISDIIKANAVYVDKTKYAYQMIENLAAKYYFLSRPRRFGKSMLLSTFNEIFKGNKELFKEQWIYNSSWDWQVYPVIRLDFNVASDTDLKFYIKDRLRQIALDYEIFDEKYYESSTYDSYFRELILKIFNKFKQQVVVLIDEYDKPILDVIDNVAAAEEKRDTLKGFYTVMKGVDENLRFVFLTGVSRFSKVGVFSGLNNLQDISMLDEYAAICGITQVELEFYCKDHMTALATANEMSYVECLEKIRAWYNGFCFSKNGVSVYNPFSTMTVLEHKDFGNYWFSSGNASSIIKLMKKQQNISMFKFDEYKTEASTFDTFDIDKLNIIAILFQAGYLTIKSYDRESQKFVLGYPNYEISQSFKKNVLTIWCSRSPDVSNTLSELGDAIYDNDIATVMDNLTDIFLNIDYDIVLSRENNYQSIFYLIFQLLGVNINVEYKTSIGRIDAIIHTDNHIYIFEFKLDKTAKEALDQIKEKDYLARFIKLDKPITLIGANFNSSMRNIDDYVVECATRI